MQRFQDNAERYNVIQEGKENFGRLLGKWRGEYFKNDQDLVVELGCGKGEYTVGLGEKMPDRNFVGVDIKGARIWVGSSYAIRNQLSNVAFLRTQIELLDRHFGTGEISEIWITFPDPRTKDKEAKRRLTAPRYLGTYKNLLKKDGWIKFKTDNTGLFDYTLGLFQEKQVKVKNLEHTHDLYNSGYMNDHFDVKTKYEKLFFAKGENIKYMKFQLA